MSKYQVRTVPDAANTFRWMIADHIWDGISAPVAVSPEAFPTEEAARDAGRDELLKLESIEARDHPFGD